jgi:hypothetical protein
MEHNGSDSIKALFYLQNTDELALKLGHHFDRGLNVMI